MNICEKSGESNKLELKIKGEKGRIEEKRGDKRIKEGIKWGKGEK